MESSQNLKSPLNTGDYKIFLHDIKKLIIEKRNNALKSVNTELISLYMNLWKEIYQKQEQSNWG